MGTILGMDTLSVGDRVRFFVVCAGLAALGVLGVLFAAGRVDRQLELNSQRPAWPTVQGRVISSKAEVLHYDYSTDMYVEVTFDYQVAGLKYTGKQDWETGCPGCDEKTAEKKRRQYSPGSALPIYYNPLDPSEAYARPRVGRPVLVASSSDRKRGSRASWYNRTIRPTI